MKRLLGILLFIAAAGFTEAQPGLQVSYPLRALNGDTIRLVCYPDSVTTAAHVKTMSAVVYTYDTLYHWHVQEYTLFKTGDTAWTAAFPLPAATGFVAYKFKAGDVTDNNGDKGYFTMVFYENGRYMAGAEAGYGLIRSPQYEMGVPGYFDHFSISDTATYMWLSNEILRHRAAAAPLVLPYVRAKLAFQKQAALTEVQRAVQFLLQLKDTTEMPLLKAWLICRQYLKDTLRADSLQQVLLARFPSGSLARLYAWNKAVKARTIDERLLFSQAFVRDFPYKAEEQEANQFLNISYSPVYRNIVAISIAQKNSAAVLDYQQQLPVEIVPEAYYKAVEIPYDDWKTMDAPTAYPYSNALYKRMLYFYDHQPANLWYYAPAEWKTYCDRIFAPYFRLHARILMELGHDEEALQLATRVQQYYHYQSADLNQTTATLLAKAGKTAALDTLLHASVRSNQLTASMIVLLRQRYTQTHGNDQGFDNWMESMKDAKTAALLKDAIYKEQLNLPAPGFTLLNGKGIPVSLEGLKGKVVVLDFWATWCAPCKAAMAGMNMAVHKYKNDREVVFLFIDTQERIPDYRSKATAFLKEKAYPFTVLFDTGAGMEQTYHAYASALHTSGIPFKAVIDKKGILRYANGGYKGSPSGLADEISTMIELAKQAQ